MHVVECRAGNDEPVVRMLGDDDRPVQTREPRRGRALSVRTEMSHRTVAVVGDPKRAIGCDSDARRPTQPNASPAPRRCAVSAWRKRLADCSSRTRPPSRAAAQILWASIRKASWLRSGLQFLAVRSEPLLLWGRVKAGAGSRTMAYATSPIGWLAGTAQRPWATAASMARPSSSRKAWTVDRATTRPRARSPTSPRRP